MKKISILICTVMVSAVVSAQAPQQLSYQTVIRDISGQLLQNQLVGMRISILQGSASGNAVYAETQALSTNVNGLASLSIGTGTVVYGNFAGINWANGGPFFIKTETDPTGGTSYTITGTSPLQSVPYALFAANGGSGATGPTGPMGPQGVAGAKGNTGATGPAGPTGAQGSIGPSGIGITGPTGPTGPANAWNITGNRGTNTTVNFIGTSDSTDLIFKVYDNPAGWLDFNNGNTSFGFLSFKKYIGQGNSAFGVLALQNNIGSNNTAVGSYALSTNTAGNGNTALGEYALWEGTGSNNVAIGLQALSNNSSQSEQVAVGDSALYNINAGNGGNTALGSRTLLNNFSGEENTATGYQALYNCNASYNTANGHLALYRNVSGQGNTAVGNIALSQDTGGSANVAVGAGALYSNFKGNNNTALGYEADVTIDGLKNATAIGWQAKVGESNALVLGHQANVGIGTSTPNYPLDIEYTTFTAPSFTYWSLNNMGVSTASCMSCIPNDGLISIWAAGAVVGAEFDAMSDKRIKEIEGLSNNITDLQTLLKLQVTNYHYIDKIAHGSNSKKGFIAQQVEQIYPEAVTKSVNYIPNVFANAEKVEYDTSTQTLTVTLGKPHDLAAGDKVRIITPARTKEVEVAEVPSENSFTVKKWDSGTEQLFVYGKQVNDFRTVDYERIYTLAVSSIQELNKQLDLLKVENAQLKAAKADASAVTEDFNQLKSQLDALKLLMEQNGIRSEK